MKRKRLPSGSLFPLDLNRRLLLRHAVNGAESPNKIPTIDGDYSTSRKNTGNNVERDAVVRVTKDRNQHESIRNIKVGVACRQALSPMRDRRRHRKLDDFQSLSILVGGRFQTLQIRSKWR